MMSHDVPAELGARDIQTLRRAPPDPDQVTIDDLKLYVHKPECSIGDRVDAECTCRPPASTDPVSA